MKNYAAIVAVCVLAGAGDAGEFLFLTPSDNGGRTISEEAVDQYDFAGKAPLITAYAPKVPVQPVLLEAMKRLGTELFANIAFDPLDTPDCFRVRAGFGAAVPGIWDGVFLTGCGRLEAPYARALAEAKQDAALVMRLRDLANQLRNKEDLILVAEGRRALKWIRNQRPTSTDPDLLRLEIGAWLRRLEAVLGLAHAPDPSPAGKIAAKAAPPDGSLPAVGLKMPAPGVPLDAAGKIRFACDWRGFTITVADPGDTCTLALDLSAADPDARLRYDMTLDIDKPPKPSPPGYPERASFPASGEMNYIQHRFGRFEDTFRVRVHGVAGRDYPALEISGRVHKPKDGGGRSAVFSANWVSLWGHWPMCADRRVDCWRVTVGGNGPACDVRLLWPSGGSGMRDRFEDAGVVNNLPRDFGNKASALLARYTSAANDFDFLLPKTAETCFHAGDVASATLFRDAYLQPLCDKKPTVARYATLAWDADDERLVFIQACYAGGPFKIPPVKTPSAVEAATAPDYELGQARLELDENDE